MKFKLIVVAGIGLLAACTSMPDSTYRTSSRDGSNTTTMGSSSASSVSGASMGAMRFPVEGPGLSPYYGGAGSN